MKSNRSFQMSLSAIFGKEGFDINVRRVKQGGEMCWEISAKHLAGFEFAQTYLFSSISDVEARWLLSTFLDHKSEIGYVLSCHLAMLLAVKGYTISDIIEPRIADLSWLTAVDNQLFMSYLPWHAEKHTLIPSLLDRSTEDVRDGLFCAILYDRDNSCDCYLAKKMLDWYKNGECDLVGTGEAEWIKLFIKKWARLSSTVVSRMDLKCLNQYVQES